MSPGSRRYVSERGKILPRRISGNCAKHQRALTGRQAGAHDRVLAVRGGLRGRESHLAERREVARQSRRVVDVAEGYARNFLLPRGLAAEAGRAATSNSATRSRRRARGATEELAEAKALAARSRPAKSSVTAKSRRQREAVRRRHQRRRRRRDRANARRCRRSAQDRAPGQNQVARLLSDRGPSA